MRKSTIEKIVNKYAPIIKEQLVLNHLNIRWKVLAEERGSNTSALTYFNEDGSYDIVIHWKEALNRKDVIGSIYHELLHVVFNINFKETRDILNKKNKKMFDEREEKMIQLLESFLLKHWR